jgi:ankyrin repeat protein
VVAFLLNRQPGHVAVSAAMVNAAIGSRDADVVRALLDNGADVNFVAPDVKRGNKGSAEPALIEAAGGLKVDIVSLLVSRGADVNVRGFRGRTALHVAISALGPGDDEDKRRNRMEIVRALLTKPVDLEARGHDYWQVTPLLMAIDVERPEIALLLIERGADANARATFVGRNRPGRSALMLAAENGMPDVVRALLAKGADASYRNELGETALHAAARRAAGLRYAEVAQALLAAGVEVNARNSNAETALMLVVGPDKRAKNEDFVQALLASGGVSSRE